jgi:hypothetical protein
MMVYNIYVFVYQSKWRREGSGVDVRTSVCDHGE